MITLDRNKQNILTKRFNKLKTKKDVDRFLNSITKSNSNEDLVDFLRSLNVKYPYSKKRYKRFSKGIHMWTQPDTFAFYLVNNRPDLIDWRD